MEKRCSFLTAPAARNSLDMIQIAKVREMRCVQRAPAKKQERYEVQTKQLAQGLQEGNKSFDALMIFLNP